MSTAESRLRRQVESFLENNGMRWTDADGRLALRFASALVHVGFAQWGEQALVTLESDVLSEIELCQDGDVDVLRTLNRLNQSTSFGRWVHHDVDGVIALEYELLGDHLQEPELMTALAAVARVADHHDDVLQQALGGRKAFEDD